jgi:hypothetical protein
VASEPGPAAPRRSWSARQPCSDPAPGPRLCPLLPATCPPTCPTPPAPRVAGRLGARRACPARRSGCLAAGAQAPQAVAADLGDAPAPPLPPCTGLWQAGCGVPPPASASTHRALPTARSPRSLRRRGLRAPDRRPRQLTAMRAATARTRPEGAGMLAAGPHTVAILPLLPFNWPLPCRPAGGPVGRLCIHAEPEQVLQHGWAAVALPSCCCPPPPPASREASPTPPEPIPPPCSALAPSCSGRLPPLGPRPRPHLPTPPPIPPPAGINLAAQVKAAYALGLVASVLDGMGIMMDMLIVTATDCEDDDSACNSVVGYVVLFAICLGERRGIGAPRGPLLDARLTPAGRALCRAAPWQGRRGREASAGGGRGAGGGGSPGSRRGGASTPGGAARGSGRPGGRAGCSRAPSSAPIPWLCAARRWPRLAVVHHLPASQEGVRPAQPRQLRPDVAGPGLGRAGMQAGWCGGGRNSRVGCVEQVRSCPAA